MAPKKANLKIGTTEHEFSIKEHKFEIWLKEDSNQSSTIELRQLIATQQKAAISGKKKQRNSLRVQKSESATSRVSCVDRNFIPRSCFLS